MSDKMSKRLRLDQVLVAKGLFASREQAQRAVMAGEVKVGTRIAAKPSQLLEPDVAIAVKPTRKYVGHGGIVLDPELQQKAQDKIVEFVTRLGHIVSGIAPSAIKGADGNQEFFACLRKRSV